MPRPPGMRSVTSVLAPDDAPRPPRGGSAPRRLRFHAVFSVPGLAFSVRGTENKAPLASRVPGVTGDV